MVKFVILQLMRSKLFCKSIKTLQNKLFVFWWWLINMFLKCQRLNQKLLSLIWFSQVLSEWLTQNVQKQRKLLLLLRKLVFVQLWLLVTTKIQQKLLLNVLVSLKMTVKTTSSQVLNLMNCQMKNSKKFSNNIQFMHVCLLNTKSVSLKLGKMKVKLLPWLVTVLMMHHHLRQLISVSAWGLLVQKFLKGLLTWSLLMITLQRLSSLLKKDVRSSLISKNQFNTFFQLIWQKSSQSSLPHYLVGMFFNLYTFFGLTW